MTRRPTIQLPSPRSEGHRYRFHGRQKPQDQQRTPVRAEQTAVVDDDGVATLRLYDPIDSWGGFWGVSAKEFADALDEAKDASEIQLHINSPGGEVFEAVAIMNQLRAHPARVVATVDGVAASAASFIAASADELVMARNTELMIHDAWGICIGNAADMRDLAGVLDRLSNNIAEVYAEKSGGTLVDWRSAMIAESWYSADEAVEAGLADRVDRPVEDPDAAADRFDLAGLFQHAGRADAPPPLVPDAPPTPPRALFERRLAAQKQRITAGR